MPYIHVDIKDYLDEISTEDLLAELKVRAAKGEKDAEAYTGMPDDTETWMIDSLFMACRSGERERVFDLAYQFAADKLGKVL